MTIFPRDRYQQIAFVVFILFFAGSLLNPPYWQYMLLQHFPTVCATVLLGFLSNRLNISRFSFTLIIVFLMMHTLGARYLYSNVPYDQWFETLFGFNLTDKMGFQRNHYDRLTHFCYGLLLVIPICELEKRYFNLSNRLAALFAIEFIVATSGLYEIIEWLVAVTLSPDWADQFLGQQGDLFDGQKDMALATLGACIALAFYWLTVIRKQGGAC